MILSPSRRVLEALAMLEHDSRFQDVLDWLKECHADTQQGCVSEHNEIQLRRNQGAANDLGEILTHAERAREVLK